jgi:hypothetical protein
MCRDIEFSVKEYFVGHCVVVVAVVEAADAPGAEEGVPVVFSEDVAVVPDRTIEELASMMTVRVEVAVRPSLSAAT